MQVPAGLLNPDDFFGGGWCYRCVTHLCTESLGDELILPVKKNTAQAIN